MKGKFLFVPESRINWQTDILQAKLAIVMRRYLRLKVILDFGFLSFICTILSQNILLFRKFDVLLIGQMSVGVLDCVFLLS